MSGRGAFERKDAYINVGTKGACRRIGVNSPANEGYWSFMEASGTLIAVVCCK